MLPPLDYLNPHCYNILPPLAAQLYLILSPPPGQITPSLLYNFIPIGRPTITSFCPLWTNYPLTLTTIYPPLQPNSYIILPSPDKLLPHSYTILPNLEAQILAHVTPLDKLTPHSYNILPPLAA